MSKILFQGPGPSQRQYGRHARYQGYGPSIANRWFDVVRNWSARSRQRIALADLVEQDDRLLRDIGVSRDEALREARKLFWQH
jgi:uncharacterized protein YjiS (DUF1127 family)